jgi:hypothetical protein
VKLTPEDRFWMKVKKTKTCWLWSAYKHPRGYGRFRYKGKLILAHRLSFIWRKGRIPKNLVLDHLCRIPSCVNPSHLQAVTHGENIRRGDHQQRRKTHCTQGHIYNSENTYMYKKGRRCRKCGLQRQKEWLKRNKNA